MQRQDSSMQWKEDNGQPQCTHTNTLEHSTHCYHLVTQQIQLASSYCSRNHSPHWWWQIFKLLDYVEPGGISCIDISNVSSALWRTLPVTGVLFFVSSSWQTSNKSHTTLHHQFVQCFLRMRDIRTTRIVPPENRPVSYSCCIVLI